MWYQTNSMGESRKGLGRSASNPCYTTIFNLRTSDAKTMTSRRMPSLVNPSDKKEEEQFPIKLHRILNEAEVKGFSDFISWMPDGRSFKILDKIGLEEVVMPHYFSSCQFKSFQRSLNMWGFMADNKKSDTVTGGGRRHHPLFVKGRPDLCKAMRRVRVKKPGTRSKNTLEDDKGTRPDSPVTQPDERTTSPAPMAQLLHENHDQVNNNNSNFVQFSQGQPNALLYALLTQKLTEAHQQTRLFSPPNQDFQMNHSNRFPLASPLAKFLTPSNTTLLPYLSPSVGPPVPLQSRDCMDISPTLTTHALDEAALRQAAIALAISSWNPSATNMASQSFGHANFVEAQRREWLLTNMLRPVQSPRDSNVIPETIRNLLTTQNVLNHNDHNNERKIQNTVSTDRASGNNRLATTSSSTSLLNTDPLKRAACILFQQHNVTPSSSGMSSSSASY